MSGNISFNAYGTSAPQSSFLLNTQGYIQGFAQDDPSSKNWQAQGVLASTETLPMWGGVPIAEYVNLDGINGEGVGPQIVRATSAIAFTGFSVFNNASHMVLTPGNTVPLAAVGNGVMFYRTGSNARISVQVDPALQTALAAADAPISATALYWDATNYRITATATGNVALSGVKLLSINTNSKIVSWSNSTASWTTGPAALFQI